MTGQGGFDHNGHTLRVLTRLERVYPGWDGLNLSWETLEGLAKHNGPVDRPGWALAEVNAAWPLALGYWPSLEAQVAALADEPQMLGTEGALVLSELREYERVLEKTELRGMRWHLAVSWR